MDRNRICAAVLLSVLGTGCVVLPEAQLPNTDDRTLVVLDQNWEGAERSQFYHQSQGTIIVPYDWFMALEQPEIKFFGDVGLFRDDEYLSRYGFLPGRPVPIHQGDESGFVSPDGCTPSDDPDSPDYNCGLPVGFARTSIPLSGAVPGFDDADGDPDVVGISCATCHTGELHYGDVAIRIDGATNMVDVTQFQSALGGALLLTQRLPFRFTRFADRVLGEPQPPMDRNDPDFEADWATYEAQRDAYEESKDEEYDRLRDRLDEFIASKSDESLTAIRKGLYNSWPGGFGRTDALARITNMVFATETGIDENLAVGNAPVKFPSIWDAPYFAWAQYNASIEQSMTRNIGEALGVRARVLYPPGGEMWDIEQENQVQSTVDVAGLFAIETLLRGRDGDYFGGLSSPVWPEQYFGQITWPEAHAGKEIYDRVCAACHLPALADMVEPAANGFLRPSAQSMQDGAWVSNNNPAMLGDLVAAPFEDEEFFLDLGEVNLGTLRTDPGQAENFARNIIDTQNLLFPKVPRFDPDGGDKLQFPQRMVPAGVGLQMVTIAIADAFYDEVDGQTRQERDAFIDALPANLRAADGEPIAAVFEGDRYSDIDRDTWNGRRAPAAVAEPKYRAHPLNGIWASPPYLHNGSIPSIYELLSPHAERSETFFAGNREYDPRNVGYEHGRFKGGFLYDTRVEGNSNTGHLFQSGAPGDGVIGGEFSDTDRLNIIEYLKSLCPPGRRTIHPTPDDPAGPHQLCAESIR